MTSIASLPVLFLLAGSCSTKQTETATVTITTTALNSVIQTATVTLPGTSISSEQAFAIAKQNVPSSVLNASIQVTFFAFSHQYPDGYWVTVFSNLNITKEELINFGWKQDAITTFGDTSTYYTLQIALNPKNGEVIFKKANNDILIGGPGMFYS